MSGQERNLWYDYSPPSTASSSSSSSRSFHPRRHTTASTIVPHPYTRLVEKKDQAKRRKTWDHVLEKSVFTPYEISTIGAPQRRPAYISSLEAHIDKLHNQMIALGFFPVPFAELEPYKGLNTKTAKSTVAGLQHDCSMSKMKLKEVERTNTNLHKALTLSKHS